MSKVIEYWMIIVGAWPSRENLQIHSSLKKLVWHLYVSLCRCTFVYNCTSRNHLAILFSLPSSNQFRHFGEKFAPGLNKIPTTKCIKVIRGQSKFVIKMPFLLKHRKKGNPYSVI